MILDTKDWYKARTYLHFDRPINKAKVTRLVTNSELVAKHAFYPLIQYIVKTDKIKFDKVTSKIIKSPTKERPISYASHIDSHIYAYYAKILSYHYEQKIKLHGLSDSILAFRALKRSNIDFALEAFKDIEKYGNCCVVALDVSKFFDTLDHHLLKKEWIDLLCTEKLPNDHFNVYKSLTKYNWVNKEALYSLFGISPNNPKNGRFRVCEPDLFRSKVRKDKLIIAHTHNFGIPQGTPISAMLSNIYMFNFDLKMKKFVDSCSGKYYRYCDDMLFIVPLEKKSQIENLATQEIKNINLSINTQKTEIHEFLLVKDRLTVDKNLQYLGFIFDGKKKYIRSSSLARYTNLQK